MSDIPCDAGKRLLASVVDNVASSNPLQRLGVIPLGDGKDEFQDVTFRDLGEAVDSMSWWMEKQIGKAVHEETVAYMGSNDIRYLIFILACHKTGYKPLLPSTRLSDEAYEHILNATQCQKFFFSREKERRVSEIKAFRPDTKFVEVLSHLYFMSGGDESRPYPYTKEYATAEDEVGLIIHSSGTTGMPKPVPLTHGYIATIDYSRYLPRPAGRQSAMFNDLDSSHLVLSSTPFFHLMGTLAFIEAIFHRIPFVNIPDKPLSVEMLVETIQTTKPTAAMLPPSILEDMSHSEAAKECLQSLQFVYFAGAPLAPETGNRLAAYTKIITVIGSSEMGVLSSFVPEGEGNWGYFEWNPVYGVEMQHIGEGLHELVIPRQESSRAIHGIFHTFPERTEYRSNDLFVRHPENPNLWKYHGRLDDVIVLSNGEKLNPVTLEKIIEGHLLVHRALLIGQSRFQTSLLVEPNWSEESVDEAKVVDAVWPLVQRANQTVPNYGRIAKSKIRLSSPEKPFTLTPKGTTQRHAVNRDYKDEIEAIYAAPDDEGSARLPEPLDLASITSFVRETVCSLLGREDLADKEDLYDAGLDSLQTIQLAKILKNAASFQQPERSQDAITSQHIYAHSTVAQLALFLSKSLAGEAVSGVSRTDKINNMVAKYAANLPARSINPIALPSTSTVILTGSTGSLGTYLLHTLINDPSISKIYCFNRSDAQTRQIQSFQEKGLDASPLTDTNRVEFLKVSFGEPHFNINSTTYKTLLNTVDVVIHNAWKVNFNHPLESFENPHIKGLHEFVAFSLNSKYNAHLSFVSSVSTIGGWKPSMGPSVPELPIEDPDAVLEQGYGESKHVSERICLEASRRSAVPTTIFRVGQIAGPTTRAGVWNRDEWVPTLVATSKAIGMAPSDLGGYDIDWIPVDTLATITIELLHSRRQNLSQTPSAFFHLMNPHKCPWASLVPAIQEKYNIPTVSLKDWIGELERIQNPSEQDVREKPALKLLDFYRGLAGGEEMLSANIDGVKTREGSATMRALGPIGRVEMRNWIDQWGF